MKFDIPQLGYVTCAFAQVYAAAPSSSHPVKLPVTCEAARTHDGVWRLSAACWILHLMNIDRHAGSSAAKRAVVSLPAGSCTDPPITLPSFLGVNWYYTSHLVLGHALSPCDSCLLINDVLSPQHQPCQCGSQATKYPDDFPGGPPEWCDVAALCKAPLGQWRAASS